MTAVYFMRRVILGVVLSLALCGSASAQVVVDSALANTVTGTNPITFAFNNVAGTYLLVGCGSDTFTMSTVTYDGTSMASTGWRGVASGGTFITAEWFALAAPSTGSHNIVVTMSSGGNVTCHAISLSGVDPGTPIGTTICDGYTGPGTTHNHSTTSQVNGLVVDLFAIQDGAGSVTPDGGQTTQTGPTSGGLYADGLTTTKAGAASVTTGYSWVNDFNRWAHCTVPVNPVVASATGHRLLLMGVGQ